MIKVCKFGGTSMADGTNFLRVKAILDADPTRKFIVVSAPGKRYGGDSKVTDLLIEAHAELEEGGHVREAYAKVARRFHGIGAELGLEAFADELLEETRTKIEAQKNYDFTVSRGEYLAGRMMAALLGAHYIEAGATVKFGANGRVDGERTDALLRGAFTGERAVMAGFYGEDPEGRVKVFTRGGSDVSGAIAARALRADLYENWTDVSGFLACDPHIVSSPECIRALSYKELRELSYMGANVLHSESIFPVREADIPIRILNTFRPEDEGTLILPPSACRATDRPVTGIAGKKNFTVIFLEKSLMNAEIGFAFRVLEVLKRHEISFEHMPSGIDTMSFVIDSEQLKGGALEQVEREIEEAVHPDKISVFSDVALIAVVGHGMSRTVGIASRLFTAIANMGVNVRMIDQGSSELNIIVGVDNAHYERTVRAVYEEFFK